MKSKNILRLTVTTCCAAWLAVSCGESDGTVNPYADWQTRNERYIDSIADVARANPGDASGQWKTFRSYKLPPLTLGETGETDENVYCKVLSRGTGTDTPLFTDSVEVHYRGTLIDGTVFDASYQGELDVETAAAVGFRPSGVIAGWGTVLQEMHAGDRWEVHIPCPLAYDNTSDYNSIPAYSALVFDLYLADIIPLE